MKQTDYYESNTIQALIVMLELMKSNQVTIYQFNYLNNTAKGEGVVFNFPIGAKLCLVTFLIVKLCIPYTAILNPFI